jgi:hypothetical protein
MIGQIRVALKFLNFYKRFKRRNGLDYEDRITNQLRYSLIFMNFVSNDVNNIEKKK